MSLITWSHYDSSNRQFLLFEQWDGDIMVTTLKQIPVTMISRMRTLWQAMGGGRMGEMDDDGWKVGVQECEGGKDDGMSIA